MAVRDTIDIRTFIDERPVGRFQFQTLLMCLVVLILDGFDVVAIGFIAPALITDWDISRAELAPVLMAGLFGLALGAIFAGPVADRIGRRAVIIGAMIFFGIMSIATAWSPNLEWLIALRFLTGLGLGASQPNAATLISEYAPKHRRSLFVTVVYCGFTLGAAGGGFLSAALIETHGWHSILIVGGVAPIVCAILYFFILPESIRFLTLHPLRRDRLIATVNRIQPGLADERTKFTLDEAPQAGKRSPKLILAPAYRLATLTLCAGLFMNLLTVYLLNSWLPVMIRDAGFTTADAALIGAMLQVGGTLGNIAIGWCMDRFGSHGTMAAMLGIALIFTLGIGFAPTQVGLLMLLLFGLGFAINSANTGWVALATNYYPTEARATGTSVISGIGRFGAIFGASAGGLILSMGWTFNQIFLCLAAPIVVALFAIAIKWSGARLGARS